MYRFFVKPEQVNQEFVTITGKDYNHIRNVLRLKPGDTILLCDESDKEYECQIEAFHAVEETVVLKVVDIFGNARELPSRITLFQGYPKGDKMELIVQKAVELGVYEIVPVMMKRSVVKLDAKKAEKKVERLNGIALSAAKQSKRGRVPKVNRVMSMQEAVAYAAKMDYILMPYEQAEGMQYSRQVIMEAASNESIAVFIGPEGGFESLEVELIEKTGGRILSLGHRILRTETAGLVLLSMLMFLLEERGE